MSLFANILRHQRAIIALDILRRRAEKNAPYKGAEKTGAWVAVVTLAAMLLLWSLPESEFSIWLQYTVAYFAFMCIGALILALTALLLAGAAGQAVVEAFHSGRRTDAEIKALQAAEPVPAVEAETGKMVPTLTPFDVARIENAGQRMNLETAGRLKPWIAAGYTAQETADGTGFSLDTVKKYAAIFRKGVPAPLSVENEGENEVHYSNAL